MELIILLIIIIHLICNFFLNETCKDAMNLTDFAEYVRPQLIDLEHIGQVGYIEGISSIIMKKFK